MGYSVESRLTTYLRILQNKVNAGEDAYPLKDRAIALDFEAKAPEGLKPTTALDPRVAEPTHVSISFKGMTGNKYITDVFRWSDDVKDFIEKLVNMNILLVVYNAYYDIPLATWNTKIDPDLRNIPATIIDGKVLTWIVNRDQLKKKVLGLKKQAEVHLGVKMTQFEDVTKAYEKQLKELDKQIVKNGKACKAELIKEKAVLAIKADTTFEINPTTLIENPATLALKNKYNEPGVPVSILFLPGTKEPVRLREILFKEKLKVLLQQLPSK